MEAFLHSPNLPEGKVCLAVVGSAYAANLQPALGALNIQIAALPPERCLAPPLNNHADCLLLHLGDNRFAGKEATGELFGRDAVIDVEVCASGCYPEDSALNCVVLSGRVICSRRHVNKKLLDYFVANEYDIIDVKQAYCKCSVCIVDETSVITSDAGIHRALISKHLSSLLIRPGFIEIPVFEYGFIGGCTGKLSKYTLAFTGSLEHHPDGESILEFLQSRNVKPVYLSDGPLFDVGSILPIREQIPYYTK